MSKNNTPQKSLKTAFIRISAENNTENGFVQYSLDDIKNILNELCFNYVKTKYAFICHDKDTTPDGAVAKHYHIFLHFGTTSIRFDVLKKYIPYGQIKTARNSHAAMQYLIHKNNPEKFQYEKKDIFTNMEQEAFDAYFINDSKIKRMTEQEELSDILAGIENFEIKEYDIFKYVDVEMYSKYKSRINAAFEYRNKKFLSNPNRKVEIWFLTGLQGTGKTTFAKTFFQDKSVCISSSSNDPLQDYKDQDILVLDDLRDDDFKFQDLLKILDPYTKSSIKSRFCNKIFLGDLIIITSYKKLEEWYSKIPEDAKRQLYRRISNYLVFTKEEIEFYAVDDTLRKVLRFKINNPAKEIKKATDNQAAWDFIKNYEKTNPDASDDELFNIYHSFDEDYMFLQSPTDEELIARGWQGTQAPSSDDDLPF